MLRRPSFGLAEVSWRWGFGGAASALLAVSFLEYLNTLPVTAGDLFLLRSRQPALISQAIAHILRGSAPRLVHVVIILALLLAVGWTILATLGRAVTAKALLRSLYHGEFRPSTFSIRSLAGLNFLRVGAALAALVGCFGASLLGGMASSDTDPSPGVAFVIFLAVLAMVGLAWACLNWFLSLASLLVVTDGRDAFGAMANAVGLCRERFWPVLAASSWFGLAHGVAYFVFTSIVGVPLMFAAVLPVRLVIAGVLMVSLGYFFVVDFLYIGRMGAYLHIINGRRDEKDQAASVAPIQGLPSFQPPAFEGVDQAELILGDVPATPGRGS